MSRSMMQKKTLGIGKILNMDDFKILSGQFKKSEAQLSSFLKQFL